ncbi:TetR/AcrR family transcriptional regulator [Actinoplanes sp. CA-051413]|uniref:TetR/AcrR family transcriptional regulator n=1 Tax=Actinoplanes sp. CA-051413 TaxID=3239899 RepID=UPI003D990078
MPRRRVHDLDHLLDTAERLAAELGAGGVTVRGLAAAADVPNGTIYHAFGSLNTLLARAWLRAAEAFLRLQTELIDEARPGGAREAVVAAATAPAIFAEQHPAAARMLFTVRREQLLGPELPEADADALHGLDARLVQILIRLAELLWDRRDRYAVEIVTTCVVDLPTALFRRALTGPSADGTVLIDADHRRRLAAAVRAVLDLPPPAPPTRKG